jgi:drug/metabolite transporter (DMT)-like permease
MITALATRVRAGFTSDYHYGVAVVLVAAVAWSSTGLFVRIIPLDAWTQLFWRGFFGGVTALVFVVMRDRGRMASTYRSFGLSFWLFTACNTAGMLAFITSMKLTTVAHVTIIYSTMPLGAALLSWLLLKEVPSRSSVVGSVVAAAGVTLTVVAGAGEGSIYGDSIAILMTCTMIAALVVQRAGGPVDPVASAALAGFACTICAAPLAHPFDLTAYDLAMLILFGMVNTGFGFILFFIGARFIPATVSGLIGALDAPLAPFWVWLVLGETPWLTTIIGGAMVIAAVVGHILWSARPGSEERRGA